MSGFETSLKPVPAVSVTMEMEMARFLPTFSIHRSNSVCLARTLSQWLQKPKLHREVTHFHQPHTRNNPAISQRQRPADVDQKLEHFNRKWHKTGGDGCASPSSLSVDKNHQQSRHKNGSVSPIRLATIIAGPGPRTGPLTLMAGCRSTDAPATGPALR